MREKLLALFLAGALSLTLAACSSGADEPGQSAAPPEDTAPASREPSAPPNQAISLPPEESEAPEETPGSAQEPGSAIQDTDLPPRDYQPWQLGYMDFLSALVEADENNLEVEAAYAGLAVDDRGITAERSIYEEPPMPLTAVMAMGSEDYSLYDVDEDGVPELFVRFGDCEAAYTTLCCTFRDGQVVCIGEFRSGHSALYTDPGRCAVVRSEGHMGYAEIYEYPMEGGVLTEERVLFTEEDVQSYTEVDKIVPGAEWIESYYTVLCRRLMLSDQTGPSAGKALLLPICDWQTGPAPTGSSSRQARTAILAVLGGEAELYGCSGDGFYGDTGRTTWAEYLQPGIAYPYGKTPFEVKSHVWQDLNGDGQEECVLLMETGDEYSAKAAVVLSEQSGAVYAYYFGFFDQAEFHTDGTIRNDYGMICALSFWKDQCCQYTVKAGDDAPAVRWQEGSPAE